MRSRCLWITFALAPGLAGCAQPRTIVEAPAAQQWPAPEGELDFFDALASQSIVTNDDALHALLIARTGATEASFEQRTARAIQLGWLDDSPGPPGESAQVGMVASIAAHELLASARPWRPSSIHALAATKRLRELGMLPIRSPEQALTGAELLALLRRMEIFEATRTSPPPLPE